MCLYVCRLQGVYIYVTQMNYKYGYEMFYVGTVNTAKAFVALFVTYTCII